MSNNVKMKKYASVEKPWLQHYTAEQRKTKLPATTMADYLYQCNRGHENEIAIECQGRKLTYGELWEQIEAMAKALKKFGVKKGEVVTICLMSTPEAVIAFYAVNRIGAVASMLDPRLSSEGFAENLIDTKAKLLVTLDLFYPKFAPILDKCEVQKVVIVTTPPLAMAAIAQAQKTHHAQNMIASGVSAVQQRGKCVKWAEFVKQGADYKGQVAASYVKGKLAAIFQTSGTTGKPKKVMVSDDNFNTGAAQFFLAVAAKFERQHNWMNYLPPFNAFGMCEGHHLPLAMGMKLQLIPLFDPQKIGDLVLKYRPQHFFAIPMHWQGIINSKQMEQADLSFLIHPILGGDMLDPNFEQKINQFLRDHKCKHRLINGYGMTECCVVTGSNADMGGKLGSVDIPMVAMNVAVFDPETQEELPLNESGEIGVRGPVVMLGYYNDEELTKTVLRKHADGKVWLHSGDIGHIDEDGVLFIDGRLKRMIVRGGSKVFPAMIEREITKMPEVTSCAVVGMPDEKDGVVPVAYLTLRDDEESKSKKIIQKLQRNLLAILPEYFLPAEWRVVDQLPLTGNGKVDYRKLEQRER
jgi:long-chain acyl-CoA synthetase